MGGHIGLPQPETPNTAHEWSGKIVIPLLVSAEKNFAVLGRGFNLFLLGSWWKILFLFWEEIINIVFKI